MPVAESLIEMNRSPAEVFRLLDDVTQPHRWLESCLAIELTSPTPSRRGTTLRYSDRQGARTGTMDGIVTTYTLGDGACDAVHRFTFAIEVDFELSPISDGTGLHHTCRIEPQLLIGRLMRLLIQLGHHRQAETDLERVVDLKRCGEGDLGAM